MKIYGTIYILINKINNKVYIGQTIDFKRRMREYNNNKISNKIHNSIKKYGWDNFDKLILDKANNKEELDILECFYIEKFQSIEFGYNQKNGGTYGLHSEESKKKISINHADVKGKNNPMYGKTGEKCPSFGKIHSEESKIKAKEANRHKMISVQYIESNEKFNSLKDASEKMNIAIESISRNINGKRNSAGGHTFKKT